jgi:hypothetical protein
MRLAHSGRLKSACRLPILDAGAVMKGCFHSPPCVTASVHHARRGHEARVARELSKVTGEATIAATPTRPRREWRNSSRRTADATTIRAVAGRAPWELSAYEFETVCEPWFEKSPFEIGQHRMFGLSISQMRFGMRLRLVVLGGPAEGYVVDVDAADEAGLEDARRAFVADALARGERVPARVLAGYPDLSPEA